jgi:hypothetical protein
MAILMDLGAVVSFATVALLIVLLIIYIKIYKNTRAVFTIGLIFFASMFMLQNAITIYAYFSMAPLYHESLLPYLVAINIAELAGIAAILKITL